MANETMLRKAAMKGFMGHAALLDPDTFVTQNLPLMVSTQVAQNGPNELGITGDYAILGQGQKSKTSAKTSANIRTKEQADLNERLLQQGIPPSEIMAREQANR